MNPISYHREGEKTIFDYDPLQFTEWQRLGELGGDVGAILHCRLGNYFTYWSYGTIEQPCTTMMEITMMHHPLISGVMLSDDQLISPQDPEESIFKDVKFHIIDFSSYGKEYSNTTIAGIRSSKRDRA